MDQILCWIEAHPGLAAWFQAIFSVIAIISAIGIAMWQRHVSRKEFIIQSHATSKKATELAAKILQLIAWSSTALAWKAEHSDWEKYKDGMMERIIDQRSLLSTLNFSDFNSQQVAAIVKVRDACGSMISVLRQSVDENDKFERANMMEEARGVQSFIYEAIYEFEKA